MACFNLKQSLTNAACDGVEYLFHGTSANQMEAILTNSGEITPFSYWGTEPEAERAAKEERGATDDNEGWIVVRVALRRFARERLSPDNRAIAALLQSALHTAGPLTYTQHARWQLSDGTWQDSLRICGSVLYDAQIRITEADVFAKGGMRWQYGYATDTTADRTVP